MSSGRIPLISHMLHICRSGKILVQDGLCKDLERWSSVVGPRPDDATDRKEHVQCESTPEPPCYIRNKSPKG